MKVSLLCVPPHVVCVCLRGRVCSCMDNSRWLCRPYDVLGAYGVHVCVGATPRRCCVLTAVRVCTGCVCVCGVHCTTPWVLNELCTSFVPAVIVCVQDLWPRADGTILAMCGHNTLQPGALLVQWGSASVVIQLTSPHGVARPHHLTQQGYVWGVCSMLVWA